jgi:hypothetical protein
MALAQPLQAERMFRMGSINQSWPISLSLDVYPVMSTTLLSSVASR